MTFEEQKGARDGSNQEQPEAAWKAFASASARTIEYLIDVYLQVVYPM